MAESEFRTITLTNRAPVRIKTADWPIVAKADGDSWNEGVDHARHQQARMQNELDTYTLHVRRHKDGRAVVYGRFDAAVIATPSESWAGGEVLAKNDDVAQAIRRVGESGGIPDAVIRECTADLPAENLV